MTNALSMSFATIVTRAIASSRLGPAVLMASKTSLRAVFIPVSRRPDDSRRDKL
jgi:hypothetical protein